MKSYRLDFPAGVTTEAVASIMRTLAAEPRGNWLDPSAPVVFETCLSAQAVTWRVQLEGYTAERLQSEAERCLPGLAWIEAEPPGLAYGAAVELRIGSSERLLDVARVEATVRRLLGITKELQPGESLLLNWQVGSWLPRPPIPPAHRPEPRTVWNLPDWGTPARNSEQVQAAREKQAEPVFSVAGRIAVAGATGSRAQQLFASVGNAYQLLRAPGVGVSRRALPAWWVHRRLHRPGVPLLNPAIRLTATELTGVIGWPVGNPLLPGVRYSTAPRLPLDRRCLVGSARPTSRVVGESGYPAQGGALAVLRPTESLRHLHIIGPSGAGKSTLISQLVLRDIAARRGVICIDPKGDLIEDILVRAPRDKQEHVVVLDPSDLAPVGFNPLADRSGVDGLLHVLHSLWAGSWGPRLSDILHAGLLTLSQTPGHTLPELPLLLTDANFRRPLVGRAVKADPLGLGSFWDWYNQLSPDATAQVLAPVMNKLRAFLLRPELRAVLGQDEPRFALQEVFTKQRCLLVRLPKGQLGSEGAQLTGSLLMNHVWQLCLSRAAIPAKRRRPTFIYLDEFQDFLRLPLDLSDALMQARGLGVGLTLAHQHLGQLDTAVKAAALANCGSRVTFRLDYDDATVLARRSGGQLSADAFSGLGAYEAYASLLVEAEATPYGSLRTRPLPETTGALAPLLRANRERWGVPAAETEARLRRLIEQPAGDDEPSSGVVGGRKKNRGGT